MTTPVHIGGLEGAVSGTLSSCKVDISKEPLIKPRPRYTGIISDMWPVVKDCCSYQGCKSEAINYTFCFIHMILHDTSLSREIMDVDGLL